MRPHWRLHSFYIDDFTDLPAGNGVGAAHHSLGADLASFTQPAATRKTPAIKGQDL